MAFEGFNIDSFKAHFVNSARTYLFYFQPQKPSKGSYTSLGTGGKKDPTYLVRSTKIPGQKVSEVSLDWQGYKFNYGGKTEFDGTWDTSFYLDSDMSIYNDFIEWLRIVHDPETNVHGDPEDYFTQQTVVMLSHKGNELFKCSFVNMYPTSISEVGLAYSNDASPVEVTVGWKYTRHFYEKKNA